MPKTVKTCVEKLSGLIEKECKKKAKDDKYNIDIKAVEKLILQHAPLKRGAKNPGEKKAKRPLSGFMIFAGTVRDKIRKEHPEWKMGDIGKEIGRLWQALSDAEKAKYKA